MENKVKELDDSLAYYMRACVNIPSISAIVEELILNSLDAFASTITIDINLNVWEIVCEDDGNGIDISRYSNTDKTQLWYGTSKEIPGNLSKFSYGCKGEALASIATLSSLEIVSKVKDHETLGIKFSNNNISSAYISDKHGFKNSGTKITVRNIFENCVVRRKNMQKSIELLRIKTYIQHIALLHHNIKWKLVDNSNRKVLYELSPHKSVASRFGDIFGNDNLSNMVQVEYEINQFKLSGLISSPVQAECKFSKDIQLLYINKRWVKDSSVVGSVINNLFQLYFSNGNSGGGPDPKHFQPKSRKLSLFPCFVLLLNCPEEEYDVLLNPDKAKAIFRNPSVVTECTVELVLKLFHLFNIPVNSSIKKYIKSLHISKSFSIDNSKTNNLKNNNSTIAINDFLGKSASFQSCFFPDDSKYEDVTVSFSTPNRNQIDGHLKSEDRESITNHEYKCLELKESKDFIPNMILKRKRAIDRSEFSNLQKISPKDSIREKKIEFNTNSNIYLDNNYTDGSYLDHKSSNMDHDGSNVSFYDECTTDSYQTSCSQIDLNSDFKYQSVASNPQLFQTPNSFGTHITLCKESLKSLKFIGQVDNKYILGISGSNILCFDQHAIDERIKLESFPPYVPAGNFKSDEIVFNSMTNCVDINLKLAKNEFFALEIVYSEMINHWGFKVSFDKDNCKLIQVPVILGEALTDQDFLEFLREIMSHPSENLSLLIPPAVKRIYNSKACRSAVKFGDVLSREACENLLAQLPHLKFPFQCAHGRVSTVPLFIL